MAIKFDIIQFAATLTGFPFEKNALEYIVMRRGLSDITEMSQLTEKDIDLLTADELRYIYSSPTQTASQTDSHGDFSKSRGSQSITDKKNIYNWFMSLYKKWGEDPFGVDEEDINGGCMWMD